MFLLAIDVGNTQITIGAFHGKKLTHTWRLQTQRHATADELGTQIHALLRYAPLGYNEILGIAVASVVPSLDVALVQACKQYLQQKPLLLGPSTKLGLKNLYKNPQEVGADRLVNAIAVHELVGGPAIVVDFGTATTFDCVSAKGDYLGGVIAPGLEVANEALALRTAKLPRITFEVPETVLGRTTKESLQSGLFFGYIALVEGVLQRLTKDMRGLSAGRQGRLKVVATGGLSPVIGPQIKPTVRVLPELTLEGLRILWEKNH